MIFWAETEKTRCCDLPGLHAILMIYKTKKHTPSEWNPTGYVILMGSTVLGAFLRATVGCTEESESDGRVVEIHVPNYCEYDTDGEEYQTCYENAMVG